VSQPDPHATGGRGVFFRKAMARQTMDSPAVYSRETRTGGRGRAKDGVDRKDGSNLESAMDKAKEKAEEKAVGLSVKGWPATKEAAEDLGVTSRTVIRMIWSKKLDGRDIGSGVRRARWRINPVSLRKLLEVR